MEPKYEVNNINLLHEGADAIIQNLYDFVGGTEYIKINDVSFFKKTLLRADIAWGDDCNEHQEDKFRRFCNSILDDLSEMFNYCVVYKIKNNGIEHWDCIKQSLPEFINTQKMKHEKKKKCDCFSSTARCQCFQVSYVEAQTYLEKEKTSYLLCHHIFERKWLNVLGLPMPGRERVYSLKNPIIQ